MVSKKEPFRKVSLIIILSILFASSFLVVCDAAQGVVPQITIQSPVAGSTVIGSTVEVKITIGPPHISSLWTITTGVYLDGVLMKDTPNTDIDFSLNAVSNGAHQLKITSSSYNVLTSSSGYDVFSVCDFTVNSGVGPDITVSGGTTFAPGNINLTLSVNDPNSKITYSLDGNIENTITHQYLVKNNVLYQCNVTLPNVPEGEHTLVVTATDRMDNSKSTTLNLNVGSNQTPTQTAQKPDSTINWSSSNLIIILITAVIVVLVGIVMLFYNRSQKKQKTLKP
jgi:hypothetical protein